MIGDPGRLAKAGLQATFQERPAIKGDRVRFFTAAGADVPMWTTGVRTRLSSFLLSILLFSGCASENAHTGPAVRDSAGVTIVENAAPQWPAGEGWRLSPKPTLDIGAMGGELEYQFFQIAGAVRMPDGRLAVADRGSGEIRFFDGAGRYLSATGQKGEGPGEFQDLFFLRKIRGDSLMVYDWSPRRVSVLSPQGEFARLFELTVLTTSGGFPIVADPLPGGDLLLATNMFLTSGELQMGAKRDSAIYYVLDPEGSVVDNLGAFPGGESYETTDGPIRHRSPGTSPSGTAADLRNHVRAYALPHHHAGLRGVQGGCRWKPMG